MALRHAANESGNAPRTKRSVRPRLVHPEAWHFVEGGLVVIFGLVAYIIAIGVITGDSEAGQSYQSLGELFLRNFDCRD